MKTKSIWEPILYGAIAGIIPCLFQGIPILIFLYLFIPILWVDLGRREGFKKTILPTVVAPIVMILTRNPVMIFTCTCYLALTGIGLSWMYEKEMSGKQRMIAAYAAVFLSIIGGMIVYQIVHHTAFIGVLAKGIETYAKNLTASYQNTDIFTVLSKLGEPNTYRVTSATDNYIQLYYTISDTTEVSFDFIVGGETPELYAFYLKCRDDN